MKIINILNRGLAMRHLRASMTWLVVLAIALFAVPQVFATPLSGAIFTTTPDGSIVNENVWYESKLEVYLDGGPPPNAPQTAAGLPDGLYVFQVTDPSGKLLLSEDPAKCRVVEVNDGIIVKLVPPTELGSLDYYSVWVGKSNNTNDLVCHIQDEPDGVAGPSGRHDTNTDVDHGADGAIVVQLMPYGTTPNPGGVYKAWITPLDEYLAKGGDLEAIPQAISGHGPKPCPDFCAERDPGFGPPLDAVKTDNFKVKEKKVVEPPVIMVRKFHDKNLNGIQDEGEEDITGWAVDYTDPLGITHTLYTPETIIAAEPGDYTFIEETPDGTLQTVSILDGVIVSLYPTADPTVVVPVIGTYSMKDREVHEVVYGNVGVGLITACKIYDRNGNGVADEGEPGIPGWKIKLNGEEVFTGEDGCTTFGDLLPGEYTIAEILPSGNWVATGATSYTFTVESIYDPDSQTLVVGTVKVNGEPHSGTFTFTNYCEGEADFDTKGYWHNKNGLNEITDGDIAYVNGLDPYNDPTPYFDDGDEPFDGQFSDGTPVEAAIGDGIWQGEEISPAGSPKAEISQFLVDQNAGSSEYYHREQLAQQLLAFIFNTIHRLDDPNATIQLPDGTWVSASSLVSDAIVVWQSGTAAERTEMSSLLDYLNNSDAIPFIHYFPCAVVYP